MLNLKEEEGLIKKIFKYGFLTGFILFMSYLTIRILNSNLDDELVE
jgi:hypothetical protein